MFIVSFLLRDSQIHPPFLISSPNITLHNIRIRLKVCRWIISYTGAKTGILWKFIHVCGVHNAGESKLYAHRSYDTSTEQVEKNGCPILGDPGTESGSPWMGLPGGCPRTAYQTIPKLLLAKSNDGSHNYIQGHRATTSRAFHLRRPYVHIDLACPT